MRGSIFLSGNEYFSDLELNNDVNADRHHILLSAYSQCCFVLQKKACSPQMLRTLHKLEYAASENIPCAIKPPFLCGAVACARRGGINRPLYEPRRVARIMPLMRFLRRSFLFRTASDGILVSSLRLAYRASAFAGSPTSA